MYAIIRTGGKQYNVAVGDEVLVEKLNAEVEDLRNQVAEQRHRAELAELKAEAAAEAEKEKE